jgi:hypothetical protein
MAKKKDLQKQWEDRIKAARKKRDEWADQFKIALGRAYFEGQDNPGYPEDEWISINKTYTHLMAQLPILYSLDPYFYVKVKKSFQVNPDEPIGSAKNIIEMERKGKIRAGYLNYLKVELKLKSKVRLGIQDAHFAYGVAKVRRASELKEHPQAGKTIVDEDGNDVLDPETQQPQVFPDAIPINERYEVSRIHPDDFLFDADSGPLEDDWNWVSQHTSMTKAKALRDRRFKKADIENIQGRKVKDDEQDKKSFFSVTKGASDDEDEIIDFWEIYNLEEKNWLVIAEGAKKPLINPKPTAPGIEGHPFAILRFTLRDRSPYPIPPVFPALDPSKEMSLSRSRLLTHRKRFNRKYECVTQKLEDPEIAKAKMETGDDGTIVDVLAEGAFVPIKDAPLDQQNLLEIQALEKDIAEAWGSPGSSRGVADADSATEAGILDRRLEIREGDRLSEVVDFVLTIARKLDQLVKFHISGDEAVKITGPHGENWVHISEQDYEDIEGEFEYSVNVGATQPRLPEMERSQWIAFLSQVVVPFPAILTKKSIMRRIAEMFHIEDEAALEEFAELGEAIVSGQIQQPGQQGGGPSNNPVAAALGQAFGPSGGNNSGGGANL